MLAHWGHSGISIWHVMVRVAVNGISFLLQLLHIQLRINSFYLRNSHAHIKNYSYLLTHILTHSIYKLYSHTHTHTHTHTYIYIYIYSLCFYEIYLYIGVF
jgi:hypothetical protein